MPEIVASAGSPADPCPLCSSQTVIDRVMPIDAKSFRQTAHGAVARCQACSFAFLSPRPSASQTEDFYRLDAYYTHGASHFSAGERETFLDRLRCHLAWRADRGEELRDVVQAEFGTRSARICDVGCGAGNLAQEFVRAGHHVTGVERDRQAVRFSDPQFEFVHGAIETLAADVGDRSFDAVVVSHVLEHVVDPVHALAQMHTVLAPGKLLVCLLPNNESLIARQSGLAWEHLDIPRHVTFWNGDTLRAAIADAGFEVAGTFYNGYCRYFSNSYIATEQRIYDKLQEHLGAVPPGTARNGRWRAWWLLARTMFAKAAHKYDSVGVVARRRA